jgi:hypothetical protein
MANIKDGNVIKNSNDNPETEFRKKRWYHRRDVRLGRVKPQDIKFLSRKYWIEKIDLAPPE